MKNTNTTFIISILILFSLLLTMPFVSSAVSESSTDPKSSISPESSTTTSMCDLFTENVDKIVGAKLPPGIGNMYKNERILLYANNEFLISTTIVKKVITEFKKQEISNPTLKVYLRNCNVIKEIIESEKNGLDKYFELKKKGDIKIKGVSIGSKIKVGVTNIIAKIFSWFI